MAISLSYCCLITNCPRGGKRGDPTFLLENIAREVSFVSPDLCQYNSSLLVNEFL